MNRMKQNTLYYYIMAGVVTISFYTLMSFTPLCSDDYNYAFVFGTQQQQPIYADKNFPYAGPLKFLRLIESASYVVSNSFHATAFSLIFEKEFCVVNRSENINGRMRSLLNDYGLHERMASSGRNETVFNPIDYGKVTPILRQSIHQSKEFLGDVLAVEKRNQCLKQAKTEYNDI